MAERPSLGGGLNQGKPRDAPRLKVSRQQVRFSWAAKELADTRSHARDGGAFATVAHISTAIFIGEPARTAFIQFLVLSRKRVNAWWLVSVLPPSLIVSSLTPLIPRFVHRQIVET